MTAIRKLDAVRSLSVETEAARELLAGIRDSLGDDAEAIADMVEGETGLFEAIEAAVSAIDECDILQAGIKSKIADLEARGEAAKTRADLLRAHIERALLAVNPDGPIRLPSMTLSLRKVPRGLVVTDEAAIPSDYWKQKPPPPPSLDRKALADALKSGVAIPGAELDNGGFALTIRRK